MCVCMYAMFMCIFFLDYGNAALRCMQCVLMLMLSFSPVIVGHYAVGGSCIAVYIQNFTLTSRLHRKLTHSHMDHTHIQRERVEQEPLCLCKRVRENDENRMNKGGKANDFTVQTDC